MASEKRLSNVLFLGFAETFLGDFSAPALDKILGGGKKPRQNFPNSTIQRGVHLWEKLTKVNFLSYLPSAAQVGLA